MNNEDLYYQASHWLGDDQGWQFMDMGLWEKKYSVEDQTFGVTMGWMNGDRNTVWAQLQTPFCTIGHEEIPSIKFTDLDNFKAFILNIDAINQDIEIRQL